MALFDIDATPGASSFGAQPDFYFDRGDGDTDALYPGIYIADAMDVVAGQFVLDTASPSDWQSTGILLGPLGSESAGGPGAFADAAYLNLGGPDQQGPFYMETTFYPNSTSLGDLSYCPLIWFMNNLGNTILGVFYDKDSNALEVYRVRDMPGSNWWSELNPDFTSSEHPVAGQPFKVRLEWLTGTVDGSFNVASDGWWKLYLNDVEITGEDNVPLYLELGPTLVANVNKVRWAVVGLDGTLGPWDYFSIGPIDDDPVVPPMQKAGYVFFSKTIVEKQAEVRWTRSYLQLLTADAPSSGTPVVLTLTNVSGTLKDQEGNNVTSGRLYLKPRGYLVVDDQLIAASEVVYDVVGALDLNIAASNGTLYDVRFDPDPSDTVTPMNLKPGYWKKTWDIPPTDCDVADL